jgi:hypothetical protein
MFILAADVLQWMLTGDAAIRHPLAPDHSCAVLQYADDTLIVMKADKELLVSFSRAIGLFINYSKSTLVPMHI